MLVDDAYDNTSAYEAAVARQHSPPPQVVIPDNDAQTVRDRHAQYIAEKGRLAWQKAGRYGLRDLVETVISRYKHIIGPKLRARSTAGWVRITKPISVPITDMSTG